MCVWGTFDLCHYDGWTRRSGQRGQLESCPEVVSMASGVTERTTAAGGGQ